MSLDRNPSSSLQDQLAQLSLQHFQSLPDELLISLFRYLSSFERTRLLSTCKRWNQIILLHSPFWQYLTVPKDLPFHLVFMTLIAFTFRSGFKLRHVVIESNIQHENDLETIFAVLAKSASSLRLLGLYQGDGNNNKTRKLAMKQLPMLYSFITKSTHTSLQISVAYFISERFKYGIEDQDDESSGLRMYVTDNLSEMLDEDMKWLSKLKHLDVEWTDSTRELLLLLENCQDLMELYLNYWETDVASIEERNQDLLTNLGRPKVKLDRLKEMSLPHSTSSVLAISRVFDLNDSETNVIGTVPSLLSLNAPFLKSLWIYLVDADHVPRQGYESLKDFETAVMLLFEQNRFLEKLSLDGPDVGQSQEQFEVILENLCLIKQDDQRADAAESQMERGKGENQVHRFFPYLVKLSVRDPLSYFKGLFIKILESRAEQNPEFQLTFLDDLGEEITSGYWAGRNWID